MNIQELNGVWKLYYAPEKAGQPDTYSPDLLNTWQKIPALVPSNVEIDLEAAGITPDPFYADNLHAYAPYEYYQWVYEKTFTLNELLSAVAPTAPASDRPSCATAHCSPHRPTDRIFLCFGGIDTIADIYLNGVHLGRTKNMLIEHEFDVTDLLRRPTAASAACADTGANPCADTQATAENHLIVHIHSTMNYARSKEYDMGMRGTAHRNEICWLRKAPHMHGWDIAPRLVSAGLWRGVHLESRPLTRITETYYACSSLTHSPDITKGDIITLQYGCRFTTDHDTLEGFQIKIHGQCEGHEFEDIQPAHFVSMNYTAKIENAKLWWPYGYGEPNLYEVEMQLLYNGEILDSRTEHIGLRTVRLDRSFGTLTTASAPLSTSATPGATADTAAIGVGTTPPDQQFQILVNNEPFFAKGTNWVPLDALHSRDAERLQRAHALLTDTGCNMIRCWGGNVYEDHPFFDLCDQSGILIWQDFAMGNTNYPQAREFERIIEEEIESFVKKVRNHPSIALWCSDNEIDYKNLSFELPSRDSSYNRIAYEILPRLIQAHDPYRVLIKSSPEIPEGFHMYNVPEQHLWGARAWYRDDFYRKNTAKFISEYGFHGCPAPSGIRKYIPEEALWPLDNDIWAVHSTEDIRIERSNGRNEMMRNHLRIMYGQVPEDLETFAKLSQIYQAEALKTMMENCRSRSDCHGLIWWNMLDCWPQISDAVVDYYFNKKAAYFYMKRCHQPLLAFVRELKHWAHPVYISNHTRKAARVSLSISDGDTGETLLTGTYDIPAGQTLPVAEVKALVSDQRLLLIRYESEGRIYGNHFITGTPAYDPDTMLRWFEAIRQLPEPFDFEM